MRLVEIPLMIPSLGLALDLRRKRVLTRGVFFFVALEKTGFHFSLPDHASRSFQLHSHKTGMESR